MLKILLVTNGFPPTAYGGVEVYSYDLARGLSNRGYKVIVFCRETDFSKPDYHVTEDEEDGLRVIRIVNDYKKIYSFRDTFVDDRIEAIFKDYLRQTEPDLIHFNHFIALSANLPVIASSFTIPSVVTLHDYWPICHRVSLIDWNKRLCRGPEQGGKCSICVAGGEVQKQITNSLNWMVRITKKASSAQLRNRVRLIFPRLFNRLAPLYSSQDIFKERLLLFKNALHESKHILVPSHFIKAQFINNGFVSREIEVLPLGINVPGDPDIEDTVSPMNRKRINFAAIGTILPTKGLDTIIEAFKLVHGNEIRLDIYGRDDIFPLYGKELKQRAADDRRIVFKGPYAPDQRATIYREIDVLVITSRFPESFSLVCREALSQGIPVIASNIGALPEIISNNVNGFLFKPDDKRELSDIIQHIANNPDLLDELECPGPAVIPTVEDHLNAVDRIYYQIHRSTRE